MKTKEKLYPCSYPGCTVMRTEDQGGATFTVCDEHFDLIHKNEKYTLKSLEEALCRIMNSNYVQAAGLPRACSGTAEKCFVEQIKENDDTKLIRQALKDIIEKGMFNWKPE